MNLIEDGPTSASLTLVLGHGAGTPMDHPWLSEVAAALGKGGVRVVRFEFPYMAERRISGKRRPPDREPVLLETYREVYRSCGAESIVVGGKSMGGRIASMVADELGATGLVCLGYPFHPPGRPERPRVAHLETMRVPAIIVQGTRDPFGTPEAVAAYALSSSIALDWMDGAGHDLLAPAVRKAPLGDALARPAADVLAFLRGLSQP